MPQLHLPLLRHSIGIVHCSEPIRLQSDPIEPPKGNYSPAYKHSTPSAQAEASDGLSAGEAAAAGRISLSAPLTSCELTMTSSL